MKQRIARRMQNRCFEKRWRHQVGISRCRGGHPTLHQHVGPHHQEPPPRQRDSDEHFTIGDEVIEGIPTSTASLVEEVMVTTETISDEKFLAQVHSMENLCRQRHCSAHHCTGSPTDYDRNPVLHRSTAGNQPPKAYCLPGNSLR